MPQGVGYKIVRTPDGTQHRFPADATDAQISEALNGPQASAPSVPAPASSHEPPKPLDPRHIANLGPALGNAAIGAGKGLLKTIQGGGQVIRSMIPDALERGMDVASVDLPVNLEPTNPQQQAGMTAERFAEFMAPASVVGKAKTALKTALKTGSGVLDALIGAGLEGASAGAVGTAQTGSVKEGAKTAAVAAGASLALQGAFKAIGAMGAKAETALIKPSTADISDGFKVENVFKHKVGGSLGQTFEKTNAKLKDLSGQLQQALKSQPGGTVNVYQVFVDTSQALEKGASKNFGQNAAIQRALQRFSDEIDPAIGGQASQGLTDLVTANEMKQATGRLGAWYHNPGGPAKADPDALAMERVANEFYARLKDAINQAVPGGRVNAINREISELIPIERAVLRRLPVEARSNVVGLGDMLAVVKGGPEGLALGLANRLSKSGRVASAMYGTGQHAPQMSTALARLLAGGTSQLLTPEPSHPVKR